MSQIRTVKAGTAVFLLIFIFFNVYIYMLQKGLLSSRFDYCILFADVVILTILLCFLVNMINKAADGRKAPLLEAEQKTADGKYAVFVWILQMAAWFPVFLAYYPGLFNYDVLRQIPQTMGSYGTHHPLSA